MGVSKKQSALSFPKNEHFLPFDTHTYVCPSEGKKCSFFGKLGALCFLETPVLRFALLPYYQRSVNLKVSSLLNITKLLTFVVLNIHSYFRKIQARGIAAIHAVEEEGVQCRHQNNASDVVLVSLLLTLNIFYTFF